MAALWLRGDGGCCAWVGVLGRPVGKCESVVGETDGEPGRAVAVGKGGQGKPETHVKEHTLNMISARISAIRSSLTG